jgi:hypothetical protein
MIELVENNIGYYEFLSVVHEISKKSQSIQKDSIKKVYQSYDLGLYRKELEKEIEKLDKLIIK